MRLKTLNDEDVAKLAVRGHAHARTLSDVLVRDTSVAYAFLAPAFFLLLFLVAYPFVLSVWFSVSDARVGETGSFVGLANFERLLGSDIFRQTLKNSLVFTSIALLLKTVLAPSAKAVNTIEFCRVCRKIALPRSRSKFSRPTKAPVSPMRASLRLNQTERTKG